MKKKLNQTGFTLIEVMIVVILMGIIFGTVANATSGINRRARDNQRHTDLLNIQSALQQYYADTHNYPDVTFNTLLQSGGAFGDPTGKTYLSNTPIDPNGKNVTYCYSPQISQGGGNCSNLVNSPNRCEYYQLCGNMEDTPTTATSCTCNSKSYNFALHSP